jgi:hypothetical protein
MTNQREQYDAINRGPAASTPAIPPAERRRPWLAVVVDGTAVGQATTYAQSGGEDAGYYVDQLRRDTWATAVPGRSRTAAGAYVATAVLPYGQGETTAFEAIAVGSVILVYTVINDGAIEHRMIDRIGHWRVGKVLDGRETPAQATKYYQVEGADVGYYLEELDPATLAPFVGSLTRDAEDAYVQLVGYPWSDGVDTDWSPLKADGAIVQFQVVEGQARVLRPSRNGLMFAVSIANVQESAGPPSEHTYKFTTQDEAGFSVTDWTVNQWPRDPALVYVAAAISDKGWAWCDGTYWRLFVPEKPLATADTPYAVLPATFETAAAQTDTWAIGSQPAGTDGLTIRVQTRTAYDDAGDETLYAYHRTLTVSADGRLLAISAETRETVDVPEEC